MTKETSGPKDGTGRGAATAGTRRFGLDPFLIGLIGMILLAYLWPQGGAEDGPLPLEEITTYGVSLIFFFYGLRLSPSKLKAGLTDWRLHVVVQGSTFVLFPLLVFLVGVFFPNLKEEALWLGVFYVAALPSTVSSSVVMVSIAGGNIPGAIFNASISSLLGVFITPLLMGFFLSSSSAAQPDMGSIMGKLLLQVVVPVALGVLLHSRLGALAEKYKGKLRLFDQAIILLIVYSSFCESFEQKMFEGYSLGQLALLGGAMVLLFFLIFGLIQLLTSFLGFSRENRITAIFCGSKKSLVHGTVMSKVIFPEATLLGIILLPLMLYHAFQLIAASILAHRMASTSKSAQ